MENCQIEAIVSFDERGQLVIPKDLRKKFNLKAGDKFALISCMTGGNSSDASCCGDDPTQLCCFTLVHTNQMKDMLQKSLNPMLSALTK